MRTSPAASRIGSRERARHSSAGAGRTRKIRSERSRAISTTGTWAVASTATSARAPTSATTGRMTAVPTTAVAVPPTATSSGTIADPKDSADDLGRDGPLEQRAGGQVDQGPAAADDRQQGDGRGRGGGQGTECER